MLTTNTRFPRLGVRTSEKAGEGAGATPGAPLSPAAGNPCGVTTTVKPGDCIHCGKEICNELGWCNSFKAAPTGGVGASDGKTVTPKGIDGEPA